MTMQEQSAFESIDNVKKALLENGLNLAHDVLHQAESVLKKSIEERKTGRWIVITKMDGRTLYECSVCGKRVIFDGLMDLPNYCDNCGAKMEGAEE